MGTINTRHSEKRARQRGIRKDDLETLLTWGDVEAQVGDGAVSITMSRQAIAELKAEGVPPAKLSKLDKLAVVMTDDGMVKTVMVLRNSGRDKRRYRRGVK